jgi:HK97 family phage major capsid protein
MEIKDLLQGEVGKLKSEISAKIDLVVKKMEDDSKGDIEDLKKEIDEDLKKMSEESEEVKKHLKETQAAFERFKKEGSQRPGLMTLKDAMHGEFTKAEEQIRQFAQTRKGFTMDVKNAIMTTPAGTVDNPFEPGIKGKQYRSTRLRSFMSVLPTTGNAVVYVREASQAGAPAFINENVLKPLTNNTLAAVEAPVRKVAHHKRVTDEMLADIPALAGFLSTQAVEELLDIEDTMIFSGANNTAPNFKGFSISALKTAQIPAGFTTAAPNRFDAILAGLATLAARNYIADTVVINPVDYFQMLSLKGNGEYLSPITFVGGQAFLAGYALNTSTAIPAGTFTVANFSRGAALYQREGLSVRFFDQDQDNAVKNLVTVVVEERIAMPLYYEDMFFVDTYANVITGITPA